MDKDRVEETAKQVSGPVKEEIRTGTANESTETDGKRGHLERDGLHLRSRHQHQGRSALTMANFIHITGNGRCTSNP
jgi:hypothetical protein